MNAFSLRRPLWSRNRHSALQAGPLALLPLLLTLLLPAGPAGAVEVVDTPVWTIGLGSLEAATYSPDGSSIATAGGRGVVLWDAETGEMVRIIESPSLVVSVAFSPDGTHVLTGSWDGVAQLWDTTTGAAIRRFEGHTRGVHSVAFSWDGNRPLTGSWDGTTRLWEL